MSDVTRILNEIEHGNQKAADRLLPLVYEELRRLAAHKMSHESPGQTLQATALVHEAYIRLVGEEAQNWGSRAQFFSAAAEAMRRILIESACRALEFLDTKLHIIMLLFAEGCKHFFGPVRASDIRVAE